MNLKDEEWEPEPTDQNLLRKVRYGIPFTPYLSPFIFFFLAFSQFNQFYLIKELKPQSKKELTAFYLIQVRAAAKSTVSTHDLAKLRSSLLAPPFNGAIPHEVRGTIWLLLLRLRSEDLLAEDPNRFAQTARHAVATENSREQIEKDVERTRPGLARFKQPAVRGALLRLLSLFCERHKVAYVQGLNELLAPFILLADTGSNPRIAYALFSAFVACFAPWTLEASETRMFEVLKRLFKYFERLLLYHDPELYWLLDRHTMTPDLYATSWFITLFSRNFTVESVLALWDLLLLEDNPLGTSFFAIALLRSKREELLSIDESRIPETLMLLTAESPEEVRRLWKIGSDMRVQHTPPSFQRLMTVRIVNDGGTPTRAAMAAARYMQSSVCLQTTPDDLIAGDAQYFTWDCRTKAEYDSGHLAQAAYLPLDHVRGMNGIVEHNMSSEARAELQHASDMCEQLRGSTHICLIGSGVRGEDKADINVLAMYLTRLGVPYVSTLRGGFEEALAAVKKDESLTSVELVDFDRRKHDQARRARTTAQKRRDIELSRNSRRSSSGEASTSFGRTFRNASSEEVKAASEQADEKGFSSFLDKTDAEVSKAFAKALSGVGFKFSFSSTSTNVSGDREDALSGGGTPSSSGAPIAGALLSMNLPSPTSSIATSNTDIPHRAISSGLLHTDNSKRDDFDDIAKKKSAKGVVLSTDRIGEGNGSFDTENCLMKHNVISSSGASSSKESGRELDNSSKQREPKSSDRGGPRSSKSPWVRDAKPGWLDEETLSSPLSAMPKGFTVNIMDEQVMTGLRLFPCKARAERMTLRGRSSEFKRRFVGVSRNYFLLLAPYQNRSHLLEVKSIRYLQDIVRITFKRSRPELVTFSILTTTDENGSTEQVVCIMPDGLKECVDLIRGYIADDTSGTEVEGDGDTAKRNGSESEEDMTQSDGERRPGGVRHRVGFSSLEGERPAVTFRSRSDGDGKNNSGLLAPPICNRNNGNNQGTTGSKESKPVISVSSVDEDDQDEFGEFQSVMSSSLERHNSYGR